MKHLTITALIVVATVSGFAQTKPIIKKKADSLITATSGNHTFNKAPKDTVICYFREITGVVKGNLMGTWHKGYIVKPKGNNSFIYDEKYEPFYLYGDKKTHSKNPVIQYFF